MVETLTALNVVLSGIKFIFETNMRIIFFFKTGLLFKHDKILILTTLRRKHFVES